MSEFNNLLVGLPAPWRDATIDVTDTAQTALAWFKCARIDFTAADVVALTALILQRERQYLAEQNT